MSQTVKKQVAFDLDTKMLQRYYPSSDWRRGYEDIKKHMIANGFKWQLGSVYVSLKPLTTFAVSKILKDLTIKHPWIMRCMRDCQETDLGRTHNKNHIFHPKGTSRVNIRGMIKQNTQRSIANQKKNHQNHSKGKSNNLDI